jgi:hypothetical protein
VAPNRLLVGVVNDTAKKSAANVFDWRGEVVVRNSEDLLCAKDTLLDWNRVLLQLRMPLGEKIGREEARVCVDVEWSCSPFDWILGLIIESLLELRLVPVEEAIFADVGVDEHDK